MAYISVPAHRPGLMHRVLNGIGEAVMFLASFRTMEEAVRRLNATSDADLAARGTSRPAEVQRIFGPRSLL